MEMHQSLGVLPGGLLTEVHQSLEQSVRLMCFEQHQSLGMLLRLLLTKVHQSWVHFCLEMHQSLGVVQGQL